MREAAEAERKLFSKNALESYDDYTCSQVVSNSKNVVLCCAVLCCAVLCCVFQARA
jgi:hypothetical protein